MQRQWEKFLANKKEIPGKRKALEMGTSSPVIKRVRVTEEMENDILSPSDTAKVPETIPEDWIAQSSKDGPNQKNTQDDETIPEVLKAQTAKEI